MKEVFEFLDKLKIKYEVVNHPVASTMEEADKFIEGYEGVPSKTMLMAGKKDRKIYLIITDSSKRIDIKKMNELLGDKLHFAKEEILMDKMGLAPGVVSLFGLLNNKDHDINVYIDKNILNEKIITFHPNVNTATIFISMDDMFKVLDELNYKYEIIEF